jgi:hypothetical protein
MSFISTLRALAILVVVACAATASAAQRKMNELDATRENAGQVLKDLPGGADAWLYPDAKIMHVVVFTNDDKDTPMGFSVVQFAAASYAQVRDHYRHALETAAPGQYQSIEMGEAIVFTFGKRVLAITRDGDHVRVTIGENDIDQPAATPH